jgi:hypothetical protein
VNDSPSDGGFDDNIPFGFAFAAPIAGTVAALLVAAYSAGSYIV